MLRLELGVWGTGETTDPADRILPFFYHYPYVTLPPQAELLLMDQPVAASLLGAKSDSARHGLGTSMELATCFIFLSDGRSLWSVAIHTTLRCHHTTTRTIYNTHHSQAHDRGRQPHLLGQTRPCRIDNITRRYAMHATWGTLQKHTHPTLTHH